VVHGLLNHEVSRSHITTHHSRYDPCGRVISLSQRPLPDNTQRSQQTGIHAPGGIRTYSLCRWAAAYLCLRPRGHWDSLSAKVRKWNMNISLPFSQKSCIISNRWNSYSRIQIKSPTRCINFSVYYPDVYLQLNRFGRFPAHHQELNDCSGTLWLYLRIVVTVVLCSWSGRSTARLSPRYEGKTRGCHCSHWAPDDGRENSRNTLSCK